MPGTPVGLFGRAKLLQFDGSQVRACEKEQARLQSRCSWALQSIPGRDDLSVVLPLAFLFVPGQQLMEAFSCDGISPLWA
jgi:hypothetical protein